MEALILCSHDWARYDDEAKYARNSQRTKQRDIYIYAYLEKTPKSTFIVQLSDKIRELGYQIVLSK